MRYFKLIYDYEKDDNYVNCDIANIGNLNDIVYSKKRSAVPLIHTTNLQNGTLVNLKKIVLEQKGISGFGVIIPRVCNPNKNKIVILADARQYALSDCSYWFWLYDGLNV